MAVAAAVVDLDDVDGCATVFRMNPRANQHARQLSCCRESRLSSKFRIPHFSFVTFSVLIKPHFHSNS